MTDTKDVEKCEEEISLQENASEDNSNQKDKPAKGVKKILSRDKMTDIKDVEKCEEEIALQENTSENNSNQQDKLVKGVKKILSRGISFFQSEVDLKCHIDNHKNISDHLSKHEKENFWDQEHTLSEVMDFYAKNKDSNIKNLLSILMHDWFDQTGKSTHNYFLIKKFCALNEKSDSALQDNENNNNNSIKSTKLSVEIFERLFDVFDDENLKVLSYYCLKVICFCFEEGNNLDFEYENIKDLIVKALKIKNDEYKTQVLKILIVFLKNTKTDDYKSLKKTIMAEVHHKVEFTSICKTSYKAMKKLCDEKFFELAFLVKESRNMIFKAKYKEFIKLHKNYFGEYWNTALKHNAQLIHLIAFKQGLTETEEFILLNTNDPELKFPITAHFTKFDEFYDVLPQSYDKENYEITKKLRVFFNEKYIDWKTFETQFNNCSKIRRALFGREDFNSKSIFEELLTLEIIKDSEEKSNFEKMLDHIWKEFMLSNKPELWIVKNPLQKSIFDYIMEGNADSKLIFVQMIETPNSDEKKSKPMHYLMLKNALYFDNKTDEKDKCLIEFHLKLVQANEKKDYENFKNLLYFFEEIHQYSSEELEPTKFIQTIFDDIMMEVPTAFDGKNEPALPRKYFLIGYIMIYWKIVTEKEKEWQVSEADVNVEIQNVDKTDKRNFLALESPFRNKSENFTCKVQKNAFVFTPLIKLLSLIINEKSKEFVSTFSKEIINMEEFYKKMYRPENPTDTDDCELISEFYDKYSSSFSFLLVYAAMKTNQKEILEEIFKYNNFLTCISEFPINMDAGEIHHQAALIFLNNKYELSKGNLPSNWIPRKVLKEFLDSRISYDDGSYFIDFRFMLPFDKYDNTSSENKVNSNMDDDYDTMKYILEDNDLKPLIKHPVIETFIKIKLKKYSQVAMLNLLMFILFYMLPTTVLVYLLHGDDSSDQTETVSTSAKLTDGQDSPDAQKLTSEENITIQLNYNLVYFLILVRLPYIIIRESFQFLFFREGNLKSHFMRKSNIMEFMLIFLPIVVCILTLIYQKYQLDYVYIFLILVEALNVILMIIETVSLFPALKFKVLMVCFQKVLKSYLYIFAMFMPLFIGCVALAFIIFDKNLGGEIEQFYGFNNAVRKYIIMYSGEIGIEPEKLSNIIQGAGITIMIILIINKSNLIISIAVNDVQKIMDQAREYNLELHAEKYVEFSESLRFFKKQNEGKQSSYFDNIAKRFLRKSKNNDPLQSLCVEKESRKAYINCVIKKDAKMKENFQMEKDTLNEIQKAIERNDRGASGVGIEEKFEEFANMYEKYV